MVLVRPLRAVRYGTDLREVLPSLISPPGEGPGVPEDGVGGIHPYSVVQLIRGRRGPLADPADPPFTHASRLLQRWKEMGVLGRDPRPGFYFYEQVWDAEEGPLTRKGVVALVRLQPLDGEAAVLPHERTLSSPRPDLLHHLEVCHTHLSLLMGLVDDGEGKFASLLERKDEVELLAQVKDGDGMVNRLGIAVSQGFLKEMEESLASLKVVVADGHHRYEAALQYRQKIRSGAGIRKHHDHPCDYVPMLLVPGSDPGLRILPTHRVFRGLPWEKIQDLPQRLEAWFRLSPLMNLAEAVEYLAPHQPGPRFVMCLPGQRWGVCLEASGGGEERRQAMPQALREVEVAVLRELVFRGLMDIGPEEFPSSRHLSYVTEAGEADFLVTGGTHQVAFLVRPARPEQVAEVALAGEVMPPKSTHFHPKPVKGLLFHSLLSF